MASNFTGARPRVVQPDSDSDSDSTRLDSTRHWHTPLALAVKLKPIGFASKNDAVAEARRPMLSLSPSLRSCRRCKGRRESVCNLWCHGRPTAVAGGGGQSFLTFEQSNRSRNVRQTQMSLFGALIMIYGASRRATGAISHSPSHS